MDEEWIIEKAQGTGGQITLIYWKALFSKEGETLESAGITPLRTPLASTSSQKEIIQALHQRLGDVRLEGIRSNIRQRIDEKLFRKNQAETYFSGDILPADVDKELEERLSRGTTISIQTLGDIRVNNDTDIDKVGIRGLLATRTGGAGRDRTFIDADGNSFQLSPQQMLTLWGEWDDYVATLEASAKALKDMSPIPTDYDNDSYWQ